MKKRFMRNLVFVATLAFALHSLSAIATSNFVILTPSVSGSQLSPGQEVNIVWTGGLPEWSVEISLIDVTDWVVHSTLVFDTPNDGNEIAVLPIVNCDHVYQFYIQDVNQTSWAYGPEFTIDCSSDVDLTLGASFNGMEVRSAAGYCQNLTTRQRVQLVTSSDSLQVLDCESAGLVVNPGDQVGVYLKATGIAD